MAGEGEKLLDTRVNSQALYVEEKKGHMYVAKEQNVTLIKMARVGVANWSSFTGGASASPANREGRQSLKGTNTTSGFG
jgi:hypothetical protein